MSTNYIDVDVVCPFYGSVTAKGICCMGCFGEHTTVTHQFVNKAIRDRHMFTYCEALPGYQKCRYYKMLEKELY